MSKRLRILSILLGMAVPGVSGWCLISGRDGLLGLVARLFYPGLVASVYLMHTVNLNSLIMALLLNVMLYVLGFFFLLRWWSGRRRPPVS